MGLKIQSVVIEVISVARRGKFSRFVGFLAQKEGQIFEDGDYMSYFPRFLIPREERGKKWNSSRGIEENSRNLFTLK